MMMIRIVSILGIMFVGAFIGFIVALFFTAVGMTIEEQKKQDSTDGTEQNGTEQTEQNSTDSTEHNNTEQGELP